MSELERAPDSGENRHRRCDHAESMYGRCAACGMTWLQQAVEMERRQDEADRRAEANLYETVIVPGGSL